MTMFLRRRWPFVRMDIGDSATFSDDDIPKAVSQVRNLERTSRKAGDLWFRVEYPTTSGKLIRVIRVATQAEAIKDKRPTGEDWPFKIMIVGASVYFDVLIDDRSDKAQAYCHVYGKNTGKRFKTETIVKEEEGRSKLVLMITRIS